MGANILLVSKGFFGDVILLTPVIALLKESDPTNRISVLCDPQAVALLKADALVDEVIPFDREQKNAGLAGLRRFAGELASRAFSVAYSFQRSARTSLLLYSAKIPRRVGFADAALSFLYTERVARRDFAHDVLRSCSLIADDLSEPVRAKLSQLAERGPQSGDPFGRLRVAEAAGDEVAPAVRGVCDQPSPYVVLVPGSAWKTKRWDAGEFRETARTLSAVHGFRVVVTGAPTEREVCEQVSSGLLGVQNLCGETSLPDLVALIRGASVVVCNDSMALHIASAVQTPVVVVFCSTTPRFGFGPWGTEARILEKDGLFCKPCGRHGQRACPHGTQACMTGVKSSEVVRAVCELRSSRSDRDTYSSRLQVVL